MHETICVNAVGWGLRADLSHTDDWTWIFHYGGVRVCDLKPFPMHNACDKCPLFPERPQGLIAAFNALCFLAMVIADVTCWGVK